MSSERPKPATTPCLCNALRQATRAVSRLYDEELRGVGLRTTQYSLLQRLTDAGAAKLHEARPAWERAQERLQSRLPKGTWSGLMDLLPELTRLADAT